MHGDQGCRTSCAHSEAGAGEIKLIRYSRGRIILDIADQRLLFEKRRGDVGIVGQIFQPVTARAGTDVNRDASIEALAHIARALQCLPSALQ